MDIVVWLRSLGLGKYEAAFRENEITEKVLPNLTAEDLKELGVAALGHRRTLLDAIAALRNDASGEAPSVDAATASSAPSARPEDRAERRQVTVMFSDLVGSTALSARMDPEDLREVISAYQKCVAETVQLFGGFVAKYMGDGVLIYFGYPQAHEDDAERAVRAGLELVAAVGALKTHARMQTRVGIATGVVVVGDLIGSGASQEQAIVGETPNLAARLQGIAEPNCVVIAESTRKLVGNLFEIQDYGAQELKGIAGPVRAWVALRQASVEGRFEAFHASGLTELVGREEELELLLRRWSKAKAGEGQVVLLSGEPGIGKSRLTAALLERLAAERHTRLRNFCSPQHTDSALYPTIGQIERAAGFRHDDAPLAKLDKLDALLAQSLTSPHDAALLAEMLSIPNDGRYPALELTSPERRQKTLETLVSQVTTLARQSPVLIIFEDAHWADPTSLELFGRIVDKIPNFRALLIVTYRPEFDPPWIGRPHVAALTLNRLGEREIAAMIDRVTGNISLPKSIRQDIIERTDGIPLFVEEMTKAVLEAGSEDAAERAVAVVPSPAVPVPASLHASLMARLDRLGPAKEVAQIGAAVGREFSHALLAAVMRKPEAKLQSALDRLVAAGLVFRQGVPPYATYLFKHALVQDAAYGTLLREARRALHARIAETLERQFAEVVESQPELLARHCTEAGLVEKAAGLWGKAGQQSVARSALVEGVAQLGKALGQIATLPATPVLRREEIKLQVASASALFHVKGYTSPETISAFERANALIEQAETLGEHPEGEDALLRFSVMYGQWTGNFSAGNFARAAEQAKQFLALAEKLGRSAPLLVAHRLMGGTLFLSGEFQTARLHLDQAITLYAPEEHRSLATRFGQDIGVASLVYRSFVLYRLGYPDGARVDVDEALKCARDLGQAGTLLYALLGAAFFDVACGRFDLAEAPVEEMFALSERLGLPLWKGFGELLRGCIFVATDRGDQATPLIGFGLSALGATRMTIFSPFGLTWLARAHAACGRVTEAQNALSEALDVVSKTNERWDEAEIHRTAGELAASLLRADPRAAESHFRQSLAIARRQDAKSFELRAAINLARLWRVQGRRDEARELLAPIFGWFTEGFDMPDLVEAKALLEDLR
jgi:class 3 adenylate cyclase/predicted ATPase